MFSDKGLLVPDELVIEIIENKLDSVGGGYLFDGFPRNVKQAEAVDEIVKSKSIAYPLIFYIDVSEDELIKRLTNRRYCPNCNKYTISLIIFLEEMKYVIFVGII